MLFTLTECPSKCMWHNLRHGVDPSSLEHEAAGEYLICESCAWSCRTALRASMSAENQRRLLTHDRPARHQVAVAGRKTVPLDTLDPELIRVVLDLAEARLQQMHSERPTSDGSLGQLAFDEVAAVVRWQRYPDREQAPTSEADR